MIRLLIPLLMLSFLNLLSLENRDSLLVEKSKYYVDLLESEKWDAVYQLFDEQMQKAFPVEKMKTTWLTIKNQIGELESIIDNKINTFQGSQIVILTCKFKVMYADLRCVYDSLNRISGFFIAPNYKYSDYKTPEYADIKKFNEQKLHFGKENLELDGILSVPVRNKEEKTKLFPVVILVHGSGPNDMDETIGPNKPFKDLAWGLATKGVAVFRYNKRTQQHPEKMVNFVNSLTLWDEVTEDVLLAIEKMAYNPDIDPKQIYVLGHSLGGFAIPRVYEHDKALAGLIIMAGGTRNLEDVILEQYNYLASLDGSVSELEQNQLDTMQMMVNNVKSNKLNKDFPSSELPLGIPASYWLDLRGYSPAATLKSCKKKVLVLQGERDYQSTMEDFNIWKSELSGDNKAVFKSYPDLNHLFMDGIGKAKPEEYLKSSHIEEYVLDDIVKFILNK